ncbi:flagellar basal body-associated FliL family protein [Sinimarinibacterium thermocellulolyticum]|uniref:Flagellar protein FliL n=1 Tax=Sinimarinibacterium thermocellulolyticum TaxID=3170016 RepID=A0ABV2AA21_9GAMM
MAAAKSEEAIETQAPPSSSAPRKNGGVAMMLIAILLSTLGGGGAAWFVTRQALAGAQPKSADVHGAEPQVPKAPARYVALEPPFIVNLEDDGGERFLQVQVELMSRDAKTIEQIQKHAPRIRSQLLLLFGQQQASALATRVGKEKLQADALAEVRAILTAETGEAQVEAVYFTSFVMQ